MSTITTFGCECQAHTDRQPRLDPLGPIPTGSRGSVSVIAPCPTPQRYKEKFLRKLHYDISTTPLVKKCISNTDIYFSIYPKDLRITPITKNTRSPSCNQRGTITGFSRASQRRLGFIARNGGDKLTSQFGMSYHNSNPDGKTAKHHLKLFLNYVRNCYPRFLYLWIMEFQKRGVVHYHLFSNIPVTPYWRRKLGIAWNRITSESREHLRVHQYKKNLIPWKMGNGSYVTKYLAKLDQKSVPGGFLNCGRFWGASSGLVDDPYVATIEEIMAPLSLHATSEDVAKYFRRAILKCYEKTISRKKGKRVNYRKRHTALLLPFGKTLFYQLMDYVSSGGFEPDLLQHRQNFYKEVFNDKYY